MKNELIERQKRISQDFEELREKLLKIKPEESDFPEEKVPILYLRTIISS